MHINHVKKCYDTSEIELDPFCNSLLLSITTKLCPPPVNILVIISLLFSTKGIIVGSYTASPCPVPVFECSFQPQAQRVLSVAKQTVCSDPNEISFTCLFSEII